jgi:FtsH-binding integral membrane protein
LQVLATVISFFVCGLVVSLSVAYWAKFGWTDRWKWLAVFLTTVVVFDTGNNGSYVPPSSFARLSSSSPLTLFLFLE